jgi:hypothetical protein
MAETERHDMRITAAIATAAILTFAAGAANADAQKYVAHLTAGAEVPPTTTAAKGDITAVLDIDTGELSYTVTFSGLSGPATAADFHGPAGKAAEAPVVAAGAGTTSPISGTVKLTLQQTRDLNSGNWYFNVDTSANPNGEIRGQLQRGY